MGTKLRAPGLQLLGSQVLKTTGGPGVTLAHVGWMWGSHGALLIPDPSLMFSLAVCPTKISFPDKVSVSGAWPQSEILWKLSAVFT